jgi:hypothetical protein
MPRIRSVKPEFFHDRKVARSCSRDARMLYVGLWCQADEHGRANGDVAVIKGQVFPYDQDLKIEGLLLELATAGRVLPYVHEGDPFLFLPYLAKHQRLEPGKVASKFPDPPTKFPDPTQVFSDLHNGTSNVQVSVQSEKIAVESEKISEPSALLYVAGSMEHGGKSTTATPPRDDIEEICTHLVAAMLANNCRPPAITKSWRNEARLLLDKDQRPLAEILTVINWAHADRFWKKNIHSVPKLREQYDKLRLAWQESLPTVRNAGVNAYGQLIRTDLDKWAGG